MSIRAVKRHVTATPTMEGAGVHLRRAFGFGETEDVDPFLLLDDFRNDVPDDYLKGFPWHPHRGIETITYVLAGTVDHADSLGNAGSIAAGDVQWMTAGRGIVHQEMPHGDPQGRMHGFQLWANLPKAQKMTDPRYQEVKAADVTEVTDDDGTRARVISGEFWGQRGPVEGVAASPQYVESVVPPGVERTIPVERSRNAFAYVFEGSGKFRDASAPRAVATDQVTAGGLLDDDSATYGTDVANRSLTVFDAGDEIRAARRRARHALPAGLGGADPRADRLVRTGGDEHAGGDPPGVRRAAQRHLPRPALTRGYTAPGADDLAQRAGHVLDQRVDLGGVGAEAQHAHPAQIAAAGHGAGDHHPAAGRHPGHQRPGGGVLVGQRRARPGDMEREQRQIGRGVDHDAGQRGDARERVEREPALLGNRLAERRRAEQLHAQPHAQARGSRATDRGRAGSGRRSHRDAASPAGSRPWPRARPAAPRRRAPAARRCHRAGTSPCADRA